MLIRLLSILCLLSVTATASAESAVVEELLRCADMKNSASKLACYDALANNLRSGAVPESEVPVASSIPDVTREVEEADPMEGFGFPDGISPEEKERQEAAERAAREVARQQEETGEEIDENPYELTATIVQVQERSDRRFTVRLDNDQVWRETQGTRVGIPRKGSEVRIRKGLMGGFRMHIDGISRIAWVERLR